MIGIDLDTQQDRQYLHQRVTELRLPQGQVNAIHTKRGVPTIYRQNRSLWTGQAPARRLNGWHGNQTKGA